MVPGRRIAEEAGDPDEQFLEEQLDLSRVLSQVAHVAGHPVDLVEAHAALDAAVDGAALVEREVVAGLRLEEHEDLLEAALRFVFELQVLAGDVRRVLPVGDDLGGQILGGGHHVGQAGLDRAARHPVELGGGDRLHEGDAGLLLDRPQPERAVGAHPREDHPDAALLLVLGERAEEEVDRQVEPARRGLRQEVQHAVEDRHVLVGRDHVDVVALYRGAILGLRHRHRRRALEQLDQHPLVRGVEVLHDDEGHPRAHRYVAEELFERLEPAGGGSHADDREGFSVGGIATDRPERTPGDDRGPALGDRRRWHLLATPDLSSRRLGSLAARRWLGFALGHPLSDVANVLLCNTEPTHKA